MTTIIYIISSLICTSLSCKTCLLVLFGVVTFATICKVKNLDGIGTSQSIVYIWPFFPGPWKYPQKSLDVIFSVPDIFLSSVYPDRISKLARQFPNESIRFTIVTLETTLSLPNSIWSHGYVSSPEWKNPGLIKF